MTCRNPRPDQFVGARSYGQDVNRTDRLYALVEELRASAPRSQLATDLPAAILARMLGIHITVAVAWQRASAGDWAAYAAEVSRRTRKDGNQ